MRDLTSGPEGRLVFAFAVPMLIGNLFQQLYNMVDSVVVGQFVGKDALAAVGVSFPILFLLIALIMGMGSSILLAQYFGAKNMDGVRSGFLSTLRMAGGLALASSALVIVFRAPLIRLFNADAGVAALGTDGIWLATPGGWVAGMILLLSWYFGGRWKRKALAMGASAARRQSHG